MIAHTITLPYRLTVLPPDIFSSQMLCYFPQFYTVIPPRESEEEATLHGHLRMFLLIQSRHPW